MLNPTTLSTPVPILKNEISEPMEISEHEHPRWDASFFKTRYTVTAESTTMLFQVLGVGCESGDRKDVMGRVLTRTACFRDYVLKTNSKRPLDKFIYYYISYRNSWSRR